MDIQSLDGAWNLEIIGESPYKGENIAANIPGSVYSALLDAKRMPDPYWRSNELEALKLMENDFAFSRLFNLELPEGFDIAGKERCQSILLVCEGLDTICDIYLNDAKIGYADNMHRRWEFDITNSVKERDNQLKLIFHSPTKYIADKYDEVQVDGSSDAMKGYPHIRKAHCMYGWDWGPRLPDAGIWRSISITYVNKARLGCVYPKQNHRDDGSVELSFEIECLCEYKGVEHKCKTSTGSKCSSIESQSRHPMSESLSTNAWSKHPILESLSTNEQSKHPILESISTNAQSSGFCYIVDITVTAPDGTVFESRGNAPIMIDNPQLWWPNGYGGQPLYSVMIVLSDIDGNNLDCWQRRIGLRTLTVSREKDEWGESFALCVNGVKVFAKGADYIPEDNILSRIVTQRTRRLLEDAILANFNTIRIWGGGYYSGDDFYDICDELGIMVWQDFMFACAVFDLTPEFERNIRAEVIDNVQRLRHHPSLALWCGNNEIEGMLSHRWQDTVTAKQRADYTRIFGYIIPQEVKKHDPDRFFWPSSPSSGGDFDDPNSDDRGNVHNWEIWHGLKPFSEYRERYSRFISEFGFQSFPCLKTVESFTEPEDRNIFSRVMEMHQRNGAANGRIMYYLSGTYRYPTDFDHLLYASQLLQAEAVRYGVEHWRRHRGRCMGAIFWQINDIWPVASWASIDYYGRWKAPHYFAKRFFAPVAISCLETGEMTQRPSCVAEYAPIKKLAKLAIANETMTDVAGIVRWALRDPSSKVIKSGEDKVKVGALSSMWMYELDFSDCDELSDYFSYELEVGGKVISSGTALFCAPKHFNFIDPKLSIKREGNNLTVTAQAYAKNVEIYTDTDDDDFLLSDNYFDMNAGTVTVSLLRGNPKNLKARSVYDIGRG